MVSSPLHLWPFHHNPNPLQQAHSHPYLCNGSDFEDRLGRLVVMAMPVEQALEVLHA